MGVRVISSSAGIQSHAEPFGLCVPHQGSRPLFGVLVLMSLVVADMLYRDLLLGLDDLKFKKLVAKALDHGLPAPVENVPLHFLEDLIFMLILILLLI